MKYERAEAANTQKNCGSTAEEKSKSLAWSSVLLALRNIKKVGEVVERPKGSGGHPGSDLHLRDVLSLRTDRICRKK